MYKKIMVPLDGSELAECVLPHVEGFVTGCRVETIVFVRVVEPTKYTQTGIDIHSQDYEEIRKTMEHLDEVSKTAADKYLKEVVGRLKQGEIEYKTIVPVGKVAEHLVDYADANEIDLILIATHGRSGIGRWVRGSIADRVLRAARAPVLMVRAEEK
ncbi:MAG: universal stress protein [Desulfobacteraceae bacterium]|jgi:nucleotide-binding universal stress UspA family protein